MHFMTGFFEASILQEAAGHSLRGRFPHLRLCPVDTIPYLSEILVSIPHHISNIVCDVNVDVPQINILLTSGIMPVPSYLVFPTEHLVTWRELDRAYETWMNEVYLPVNALRMINFPTALQPMQETVRPLEVELVGGCSAEQLVLSFLRTTRDMGLEAKCLLTIRHSPIPVEPHERGEGSSLELDRLRVAIPPFRAMHPDGMGLYYCNLDYDQFFSVARNFLLTYLDTVLPLEANISNFVIGFIIPPHNPLGLFLNGGGMSNLKRFVSALNSAIEEWCNSRPSTYFIDGDAIAAVIGKGRVDDGLVNFYGHRGFIRDYDAVMDEGFSIADIPVGRSFEIESDLFLEHLVREILQRRTILTSEAKIKLVIIDLDNTLWRGLASDMRLGSWEGRPLALVEALFILKKRGVLLAIVSKNDESFIRDHWHEILGSYAVHGLSIPLSLDVFAMIRINFKPKAHNIGEILAALNILPEHALFIDDNPLERDAVIAAFPQLRTLGAEPNYIRRELLCSPYLQNITITDDDLKRGEVIRKRIKFWESGSKGEGEDYLVHLGLRCIMRILTVDDEAARERAFQLLNKTNQWNLNGWRIDSAEMLEFCSNQQIYIAEVLDSGSSYGTVVIMILSEDRKQIVYMAISCRVIGMGVDEAVISEMIRCLGPLTFSFVETDRNRAARSFFHSCGWNEDGGMPHIKLMKHPAHIKLTWFDMKQSVTS